MNTEQVVATLRDIQRREGWSDREMGRQLGVNHTTWRGIKIGRHGPGVLFLTRAVARFPELVPSLFLAASVSDGHREGDEESPRDRVA